MVDDVRRAILRGERTRKWHENKEVQRVFAELKEDICTLWMKTASDQEEERERFYRESHGLRALEKRIKTIIEDGKKAQAGVDNGN